VNPLWAAPNAKADLFVADHVNEGVFVSQRANPQTLKCNETGLRF